MGDAVGANYGDKWRKIRKYFDPEFSLSIITQIVPRFCKEIRHWILDLASEDKTIVNSKQSFELLMFRLLAIQLYGEAFDEQVCIITRVPQPRFKDG